MSNILATPEDLFRFLNVSNDGGPPSDRVEALLDDVADQVFRESRQEFAYSEDDTVTLDGSGRSVQLLPQLPVVDVVSVVEDGTTLGSDLWQWSMDGRMVKTSGYWTSKLRGVVVTYSHGFEKIPASLTGMVCRVAARAFVNPTGLTQEAAGGWSGGYGFDSSRFPQLTEADREQLKNWMAR